ncbi:thioesterase family protein [Cupriavidus sp. AU9028]|uniref:thioesterase family protein n=1 Tax=Cupriavidus sp. AU9028 TaxID=2871157 RepID=UPI001C93B01E|nr:thioesterase family protein [Cupriavidus sp. AU9028]MBY4898586.1 thioesterase family protein [Cupriavidus sp. AU9028]
MPSPASVFVVDRDRVASTELSRGPWHPSAQHGGAPAALLAAMAQRAMPAGEGWLMTRLTVEFPRPVPVAPLQVELDVQPGGSVRRVALALRHGDEVVARAIALFVRERTIDLAASRAGVRLRPPRLCTDPIRIPGMAEQTSFHYEAMESRVAAGEVGAPGPAAAWFRFRVPLVEGWQTPPCARAAAAADFANGISWTIPLERYLFANADLTVYLHRQPRGEWVGVDAETIVGDNGVGLTRSTLHDEDGPIGFAHQTLVIKPKGA